MYRPVRLLLFTVMCCGILPGLAMAQNCNSNIPISRPDSRYVDNGDGTVTDTVTGLLWKQCAEGLSGSDCTGGAVNTYTWQQALQRTEDVNAGSAGENLGYTDWRLPNLKELRSLVELACDGPAINEAFFPGTPLTVFWSSSPAGTVGEARYVDFDEGGDDELGQTNARHVRLVRTGS